MKNCLRSALTEIKSLQDLNRLLSKELETATTKTEVITGTVTHQTADESQNYWYISNHKKCNNDGYMNSRRNNIAEYSLTPSFYIPVKNNFDVLTNLTGDQTNFQDTTFAIQNSRVIKRNRKSHRITSHLSDSHITNPCAGEARKKNQVNYQDDTNIPKTIPTIINDCISPVKDEKLFFIIMIRKSMIS
jgi:hypothetical protein